MSEAPETPPGDDPRVHALLAALGEATSGRLDERLDAAFRGLDGPSGRAVFSRAQWLRAGAGAVAAGLLVAVVLWGGEASSANAAETVAWLRRVALNAADRRYDFYLAFREPRPLGHTSVSGEFFIRGGEASLQRLVTDNGRRLTIGRLEGQVWLMGQRGPVVIRDARPDAPWGPQGEGAPPLLSVAAILDAVGEDYALEDRSAEGQSRLLIARRIRVAAAGGRERPETAELRYAPTGEIERIELRWQTADRPRLLRLELRESPELAPDWYRHENHHAPERRVIDRSGKPEGILSPDASEPAEGEGRGR